MSFKFIDLYAGIGGFRLAFDSIGGECVFTSEIDKYAQQTYRANHTGEVHGDIAPFAENPELIPEHDLLTAGFPCQSFSLLGIQHRTVRNMPTGLSDKDKGNQFFNICKIIKHHQPKVVLLENVRNLLNHKGGIEFQKIMMSLTDELGYHVDYEVIDSRWWVPQKRKRVFIVATKNKIDNIFDIDVPNDHPILKDILETEVNDKYTLKDGTWNCLLRVKKTRKEGGNGVMNYHINDLNLPAETLVASYYKDGKQILIEQEGRNPRKLTPTECKRLMGFPENLTIPVSDTQAYRQFGNAVVVPVVRAIAERLSPYLHS